MGAKHSKGPWALEEREGGGFKLSDADGEFIDYITDSRYVDDRDDPEAIANARLIAAAPDLLEAAEDVVRFWSDHGAWGDFASLTSAAGKFAVVANKARAAILKAKAS